MDRPGPSTWPFVGRDDTLARLRAQVADPDVVAVVLTAPAGGGKTRLAREITADAALPALWWQAAEAVTDVPFGALATLLGEGDDATPVTAFRRIAALVADHGGVVVVDDAPHLDARSSDLLRRLVADGKATVVATARSTTPVPSWIEWLWAHEDTRHHELAPLDDDAVDALVEAVLADLPADERRRVASALAARAAGNPLFLRELLRDVRDRVATGAAPDPEAALPAHLARVLASRRAAAGDGAVAALEAVAILGALPLDLLTVRVGADAVDAAEAAGLVLVDGERPPTARPAHPLHAEAVLGDLPSTQRRERIEDLGTALLARADVPRQLRLAAVALLVRQGTPPGSGDLVDAARTAFAARDHVLAAEIAGAAIDAGDRFEARLVLGAALSGMGESDAADRALRDALAAATSDDERARAAGRLSVHLVAHGTRVAEADEVLAEVESGLTEAEALAFVQADRAKLATIRGERPTAVPAAGGGDLAALNGAIAGAYVEAMAGDHLACRATIDAALPLAEVHRDVLPSAEDLVRFSGTFAALVADGPCAAVAEARAGIARSSPDQAPTVGTWQYLHGFALTVAGDLAGADAALSRAAEALAVNDLIGARPLAVASRAWGRAQCGEVDGARALLDDSLLAASVDGRVRTQVVVADAWCDAVEGRRTVATDKLRGAARQAAADGQVVAAAIALHELIRVGSPAEAATDLRPLVAAAPPSWLLGLVLERAEAEAAADDAALARLARRAEGRWPVAAAELHAARSRRLPLGTDRARAEVAALVAADSAASATDPTASTVPWTLRDLAWPISARERQVAEAVAGGASNRTVSEAAGVSVRTVENQLQSVYRKLGLAGRHELTTLFAVEGDP